MKKAFLFAAAFALLTISCSDDAKPDTNAAAAPTAAPAGSIAYVDADSLQEHYQMCADARATLDSRAESYKSTIASKEQALQSLQKSIQTRMQNGQISTEAQYQSEMRRYQSQEKAYIDYRGQIERELADEQATYTKALQDSVDHFLKEYNKDKHYSVILYRAAILYTGSSVDITKEVIAGLNKRYAKNK